MSASVSVIVLVWNGEAYIQSCLDALLAQTYSPLEVIVVDNHSSDNSRELVRQFGSQVRLIESDYNRGFAGGNNLGIAQASGEIVILLNQDAIVQPGWAEAIVSTFASDVQIGIVGCKSLYPESLQIQHAGGWLREPDAFAFHTGQGETDEGQYETLTDPTYVTGAAFAVHRRVIEQIGGLDSRFYPAFYEEIDYCVQARNVGFRVVYQPKALIHHHETTTLDKQGYVRVSAFHRNRVRFVLRHWDENALTAFCESEKKAIDDGQWVDDIFARSHAYWENRARLAEIMQERAEQNGLGAALTEGTIHRLAEQLQGLRQQAYVRVQALLWVEPIPPLPTLPEITFPATARPADLPFGEMASAGNADTAALVRAPLPDPLHGFDELLAALRNDYQLKEHIFESRLPLLGKFVARARSFLVSLATKWYVLPVMHQQTLFNQNALHALSMLNQHVQNAQNQQHAFLEQQHAFLAQQQELLDQQQKWLHHLQEWLYQLHEWQQQHYTVQEQQQNVHQHLQSFIQHQMAVVQAQIFVLDRRVQNTQWMRERLGNDDVVGVDALLEYVKSTQNRKEGL